MNCYLKTLVGVGLITTVICSGDQPPSVTVEHMVTISVRKLVSDKIAAVVPTEPGQIGINPPPLESIKGSIGINTEYLTDLGSTTKWIGPDPSFISVATTTQTQKGSAVTATITKGVGATKNTAGGIDILLSPAVKAKLEAIAGQITPCTAKRSRKRGGACGLADFVQRVGADDELRDTFSRPLTDDVWGEIDEGYVGEPGENPGWEGDGTTPAEVESEVAGEDIGYFMDNDSGFFEGAQGAEGTTAGNTVEGIVFGTAEEAAAIAAAGVGEEVGVIGATTTITAASLLAFLWNAVKGGGKLDPVYQVPKESIHKITKTKSSTKTSDMTSATASSSSACATGTDLAACGSDCGPTSVGDNSAQPTLIGWACSEGGTKGCKCNPESELVITLYDEEFQKAIWDAIDEIEKNPGQPAPSIQPTPSAQPITPAQPKVVCPLPLSEVPSKFLDEISASFCGLTIDFNHETGPYPYDMYGKMIGHLARRLPSLAARTPPENRDMYKDYIVSLDWKPHAGDCLLNKDGLCTNAFDTLVKSNCGNNEPSDRLFQDAKIDVGCGEFSWKVTKNTAPALKDQRCTDAYTHSAVNDDLQRSWASIGCNWYANKIMKPGDPDIVWRVVDMSYGWHSNWKISWINGCNDYAGQNATLPIDGDSHDCNQLQRENYKNCNNGGAGGVRDAGCLRYEFYVIG